MAFCQTSASMQPPPIEPIIAPSALTSILEPMARGVDPLVDTTVARAAVSPAAFILLIFFVYIAHRFKLALFFRKKEYPCLRQQVWGRLYDSVFFQVDGFFDVKTPAIAVIFKIGDTQKMEVGGIVPHVGQGRVTGVRPPKKSCRRAL